MLTVIQGFLSGDPFLFPQCPKGNLTLDTKSCQILYFPEIQKLPFQWFQWGGWCVSYRVVKEPVHRSVKRVMEKSLREKKRNVRKPSVKWRCHFVRSSQTTVAAQCLQIRQSVACEQGEHYLKRREGGRRPIEQFETFLGDFQTLCVQQQCHTLEAGELSNSPFLSSLDTFLLSILLPTTINFCQHQIFTLVHFQQHHSKCPNLLLLYFLLLPFFKKVETLSTAFRIYLQFLLKQERC